MNKQKNILIIIVILVGLVGIFCYYFNKEEKSHETPNFKFAELGICEVEVKKNAGEPIYEITNKEEIVKELFEYKYKFEEFIKTYKKSSDGEIEKKLDVLNNVLRNNPQDKNLKKVVYKIIQTDDEGYTSDYQKSIYYLDKKLIYF
ncbi:hypothetical protein ETU10_08330 [Apibacter muscae]|uniref:hypothetical protein n=1 Tax=Apibacter muscae TaxID=2509004 RepID=UPI0011ACB954|nr:hypothetical protein [Apibacter muscae]TWP23093.1 hypothetical protein ETU10_08330 [Apibacter muscae]